MRRSVLLTIALALLALPAAAHATTVSLTPEPYFTGKTGWSTAAYLAVTAASGERNDMTISWNRARGDYRDVVTTMIVADRTAPLTPGTGCAASADAIACTVPGTWLLGRADVDLGDRDDRVTIDSPLVATLHGGPGDDRLDAGQASWATLDGGAGADVLIGSNGGDQLLGGDGPDSISGGGGIDTVSYADHTVGITVRLGGSTGNGAPGEGDAIAADIEAANGGSGDDELVGTDANDTIVGGPGNDRILGLGGDDVLTGGDRDRFGTDADAISGGDGDDKITAVGRGSVLDGGAGSDMVTTVGPNRVTPSPGADLVEALGGGAIIDTRDPDAAADQIRCSGGAAQLVTLGDADFSAGCGPRVRQAHPRALAVVSTRTEIWHTPSLVAGLDLACADVARHGCAVRLSLRNVTTGRILRAQRLGLWPGNRVPLSITLPPGAVRDSDRRVDYVASTRAPSGEVQTMRWHAWLPGGWATPTDGNGGRDAPIPVSNP